MSNVTVSDARAHLPELLQRVEAGEEVTLTRHGRDVAVLVRPDILRVRRNSELLDAAAQVGKRLQAARQAPLPAGDMSVERAEELVEELRSDRDGRG